MVRVFDRDGKFSGRRSVASVERWLDLGRVTVERNAKGEIRFAYEKKIDGIPAVRQKPHSGTK